MSTYHWPRFVVQFTHLGIWHEKELVRMRPAESYLAQELASRAWMAATTHKGALPVSRVTERMPGTDWAAADDDDINNSSDNLHPGRWM